MSKFDSFIHHFKLYLMLSALQLDINYSIASSKVETIRLCRGHVWKKLLFDSFRLKIVKYTSLRKILRYDSNLKNVIFEKKIYKMK